MVGYRRYEGIAAAKQLATLHERARLFVNVFQASFKLAAKTRDGARVTKRYHKPLTPCDRLLADARIGQDVRIGYWHFVLILIRYVCWLRSAVNSNHW